MPQLVYILTNPTMPDLVKIGCTKDKNIKDRIRDLSSPSGVPVRFECFYCCEVEDCEKVERGFHKAFGDHRINPKREFFRIDPEKVKSALELLAIRDVTPSGDIADSKEEEESLNRAKQIRPQFTFSMVDIPIGAEVSFYYNKKWDKNWVATVVEEKKVKFEGKLYSLNKVTKLLMRRGGKPQDYDFRGPSYWLYEGETLTDRRLRMEEEGDDD